MNQGYETISSRQNPKIKNLVQLQKHTERIKQNFFVIEGIKEISKAINAGYQLESVFFNSQIFEPGRLGQFFGTNPPKQFFEVSGEVFAKIAYRENSGGLIALAKPKLHSSELIRLPQNPLILVIEGVEKPGNIGAIYRVADAAGVCAILICDPKTDLYNPNTIRASLGCVFTVPTIISSTVEAIEWLKNNGIHIFCTHLKVAMPYYKADFTVPSAVVMGTEDTGVSKIWLNVSEANIIIPMLGAADSMNVSTSAAVIIFEACRQRRFR